MTLTSSLPYRFDVIVSELASQQAVVSLQQPTLGSASTTARARAAYFSRTVARTDSTVSDVVSAVIWSSSILMLVYVTGRDMARLYDDGRTLCRGGLPFRRKLPQCCLGGVEPRRDGGIVGPDAAPRDAHQAGLAQDLQVV
jgi:hypothetical protein